MKKRHRIPVIQHLDSSGYLLTVRQMFACSLSFIAAAQAGSRYPAVKVSGCQRPVDDASVLLASVACSLLRISPSRMTLQCFSLAFMQS